MKKLLSFVAAATVSIIAFAQDEFAINDEGALYWRKVYQAQVDAESVEYYLRSDGRFHDIQVSGNLVTAELRKLTLEFKSLGYKRMSLPIYIPNDYFSGFVTIQIRDGRYRVTVERIITTNPRLGKGPLDDLALSDGEFKEKFLGAPAEIINHNFDTIFSKLSTTEEDEW